MIVVYHSYLSYYTVRLISLVPAEIHKMKKQVGSFTFGYSWVIRYNSYSPMVHVCLSPIFLNTAASSCCFAQSKPEGLIIINITEHTRWNRKYIGIDLIKKHKMWVGTFSWASADCVVGVGLFEAASPQCVWPIGPDGVNILAAARVWKSCKLPIVSLRTHSTDTQQPKSKPIINLKQSEP